MTTKIGSGATPRGGRNSYKDTGITLVRSQNVFDLRFDLSGLAHIDEKQAAELGNVEVRARDVLLNITGASVARCCMIPDHVLPARVNQHVSIVRANPDMLDAHFLLYSLNSPPYKQHLLTLAQGGATREALTKETIGDFELAVPALPTQRKIAAILSAYDDLIENNLRRIKILEEIAQLIYSEWFVHFRFPGHEGVRMVDSPLGPIPKGWRLAQVSELANVLRGRSYRGKDLVAEGGLPFLNLKCIDRDGGFRRDGVKRYAGEYTESQMAHPRDIIVGVTDVTQERRVIARAALVPDVCVDDYVFSMDLVKVEPKGQVPREYLYATLRFSRFPNEVKQKASGTNVLHLRPAHIEEFEFVLPPAKVQNEYAVFVQGLYSLADVLHRQADDLRYARDLLLPRLVSGQIDVSDLRIETRENVEQAQ